MNFPLAYGGQVGAIRHGVCGWDVELSYFQVDGFNASVFNAGPVTMVTDANGAFALVSNASADYRSALYRRELNLRKECAKGSPCCPVSACWNWTSVSIPTALS